mgnify:CR=1 FL=1
MSKLNILFLIVFNGIWIFSSADAKTGSVFSLSSFSARVSFVESLGEYALVYASVKGSSSDHDIIAKVLGTPKISKGDQVSFQIQKGKLHLFDEEGKRYVNGKKQI